MGILAWHRLVSRSKFGKKQSESRAIDVYLEKIVFYQLVMIQLM